MAKTLLKVLHRLLVAAAAVVWVNGLGALLRLAETNVWQYASVIALVGATALVIRWRLVEPPRLSRRRSVEYSIGPYLPRPPHGYEDVEAWTRGTSWGHDACYDEVQVRTSYSHAPFPTRLPSSISPYSGFGGWTRLIGGIVVLLVVGVALILFVMNLPRLVRGAAAYNLYTSCGLVLTLMIWTLRPAVLRQQTWKKLSDVWLKLPTLSAFGFMAFGVVAAVGTVEESLVRNGFAYSQVPLSTLGVIYALTVLLLVVAHLTTTVGKASASEESNVPLLMFVLAMGCAWVGTLGAYTLFVDGVILTLYAHLVTA
jgi:hypothetical protein